MKHDFVMDGDSVDVWQLDEGYHNGPRCLRCGGIWCQHCHSEVFEEECSSGQLSIFD